MAFLTRCRRPSTIRRSSSRSPTPFRLSGSLRNLLPPEDVVHQDAPRPALLEGGVELVAVIGAVDPIEKGDRGFLIGRDIGLVEEVDNAGLGLTHMAVS